MENENVLAIDIGGTSIKIGVVHDDYIEESTSFRNKWKGQQDTLVPDIKDLCFKYIEKYNIKKIGIGTPGEILNDVVIKADNLGWRNFDIKKAFYQYFEGFEIKVTNDGYAACLAEMKYGTLKSIKYALFVTFGRGVGGALISNGKIFTTRTGAGCNFGHMVTHVGGRKCNCGRRGCYETYTSVIGLINTVREFEMKSTDTANKFDTTNLNGFRIVELYKQENPIVIEALRRWNNEVAEGFINLCQLINPEIIVMAGGITESGLVNLEQINQAVKRNNFNCDVVFASFKGKTGLVGAATQFKFDN